MADTSKGELLYDLVHHEDEMYYQRSNFFLIAESMILVAYSLLAAQKEGAVQGRIIAGFGLLLTVIWSYAIHSSLVYFKYVQARAEAEFPDYADIRAKRPRGLRVGATHIMTYAIPSIATTMWIILLLI